ncbi:GTPase family protein [Flavimobilis marinus]|uniref:GTPase family protein n=1 Tax=Flavimobilis marinus TaxID=285351 RepID=UPI000B80ABD3|nr:GTPase [Flavimobilis marinus]
MRARRGPGADVGARVELLDAARVAGGDALVDVAARSDPELVAEVEAFVRRARERIALSLDRTVVAFAGSTGSGKSSLVNAVAGRQVAVPGVRRPTTAEPVAAVWPGPEQGPETDETSLALLRWLDVKTWHDVPPAPPGAAAVPDGLLVLDLPDHDSVVVEHRLRADRLLARADVMVWVTDPQKYADDALHAGYLRELAGHEGTVVVVLNQADRLQPAERDRCLADLRRLVDADGLRDAVVLATSAQDGTGVADLRALLARAAAQRTAANERLAQDCRGLARRVVAVCGDDVVASAPDARLRTALAKAAGADVVVGAVRSSTRRTVRARTGWPVTRWVAQLRPDPLRRLGLGNEKSRAERPDLARTSLPQQSQASRAAVSLAVRDYVTDASAGAPEGWTRRPDVDALTDALDQAVAGVRFGAERVPWWARAVSVAQYVLLGVAVVGLAWLALLAGLDYLRVPFGDPPTWEQGRLTVPVPTAMLVLGVLAGLLLAVVGGLAARVTAARRARRARARIEAAVADVVAGHVTAPVARRLAALAECREAARRAAR